MADLGRRSMLIEMCKVGAAGLAAAVLPSAAQSLPLAGLKPAPVGKAAPDLQELALVVVVTRADAAAGGAGYAGGIAAAASAGGDKPVPAPACLD